MFSLSGTEPWPRNNILNNKNKNKNNNNHKNNNRSAHPVIRLQLYKVVSLLTACFLLRTERDLQLVSASFGFASLGLPLKPVAAKVFAPCRFKQILDYTTITAKTYQGLPLAALSSTARSSILESLVRGLDEKLHPGSVFQDAERGRCVDGAIRSRGNLQYNWQRDGIRVQLKTSQLIWNKSDRRWLVQFRNVKLKEDDAVESEFDELLVALYTP
ncbi:unnamed protein product [Polarella glacialis]|uniref:Uncharacterized protein n=1 Tax=Polarella glacialis TaxID=89957 RepID=A0A813DYK9_POLGL|nr:unnamed protein product [Polarella glacialis]